MLMQDDSQYQLDWAASQPPPASEPAPDADGEDDEEKDSLQVKIFYLIKHATWTLWWPRSSDLQLHSLA